MILDLLIPTARRLLYCGVLDLTSGDPVNVQRAPRTNEMASIRFDFPAPFGPMTAEKSLNGPIICFPAYDLKLNTSRRDMRPIVMTIYAR